MQSTNRTRTVSATAILLGMALIYGVLIFVAGGMTDAYAQTVLIGTGCAVLGAGLVFFLFRMTE